MIDRVIKGATTALIVLMLIHGGVITFVHVPGVYLYGLFGLMLAALVTLITGTMIRRY